jgi:diamine N-acetyltransferase
MLVLRNIKREDLDFLYNVENNPANMVYGDYHEPYSLEILQDYIANALISLFVSGQYRYVIEKNKIAIGFLDLFNYNAQDASASVGIILDTAFRGQALAKVALTLLEHEVKNKWGIERLRAKVFLDNTISITLFRRLGYEEIKHCLEKDYEGVTKKVLISEKILK